MSFSQLLTRDNNLSTKSCLGSDCKAITLATFLLFLIGSPCLSFDVLKDGDGDSRDQYPLSMLLCAGTQASTALSNRWVL